MYDHEDFAPFVDHLGHTCKSFYLPCLCSSNPYFPLNAEHHGTASIWSPDYFPYYVQRPVEATYGAGATDSDFASRWSIVLLGALLSSPFYIIIVGPS